MEKTEMMKRYESETGSDAVDFITEYPFDEYTRWLEAKAEAYDRLMSGGKKTLTNKKSFSSDEFLEEVKKFLIGYGFYLTDMEMTVTPKPTESEYGFMKYAIGKRQIVITGEVDWIDKEITK